MRRRFFTFAIRLQSLRLSSIPQQPSNHLPASFQTLRLDSTRSFINQVLHTLSLRSSNHRKFKRIFDPFSKLANPPRPLPVPPLMSTSLLRTSPTGVLQSLPPIQWFLSPFRLPPPTQPRLPHSPTSFPAHRFSLLHPYRTSGNLARPLIFTSHLSHLTLKTSSIRLFLSLSTLPLQLPGRKRKSRIDFVGGAFLRIYEVLSRGIKRIFSASRE